MANESVDPAPSRAELHQAALNYLARYASSEAGLRRVLRRRIQRWAQTRPDVQEETVAALHDAVEQVIAALAQAGLVNDVSFAEMRARSLARGGQSERAVRARLVAKGVPPDVAENAVPRDPEGELAAALITARRRRLGPYRGASATDDTVAEKALARLARAGFSLEVARQALDMSLEEAEERIHAFRR